MVAIKRAIEPYEKQKAYERQLAGKKPLGKFPKGRAAEQVAGFVGVSYKTLDKAEDIVKAAEQQPEMRNMFLIIITKSLKFSL
jgi:hypothetical protein